MGTDSGCSEYSVGEGGFDALADFLGDGPETVIPVHNLRRRSCKAFAARASGRIEAAIVQTDCAPAEPTAHGADAGAIFEILRGVQGWRCVNASDVVAQALGRLIEKHMGLSVKTLGDVYFTLAGAPADLRRQDVRELVPDDVALLEAAPAELRGCGFGSSLRLLEEGVVACGLVSGRVVATAHTSAISGGYADIGVFTAEGWRGLGYATACTSMVVRRLLGMGLRPVWSAGENNPASIRIAEKVGFERVSRRTYLIAGSGRAGASHGG